MSKFETSLQVQWANTADPAGLQARCPICGDTRPKPLRLTVHLPAKLKHGGVWRLFDCPGCTGCFYEDQEPPDYAADSLAGEGRLPLYLQQGAGLSLITRPLARLNVPPGAAYLEVGCGYGFAVDYAARAKGWVAQGIDPGAMGVAGARALGIRVDCRYLSEDEPALAGQFDVVMASETIEHVRSPAAFVRILRAALRTDGTLVLTTPDAAELVPSRAPGVLIPLLSPGLHLSLHRAGSLRRLLQEAGFAHVAIERDGSSLVALASDAPLRLELNPARVRSEYRTYLVGRAACVEPGSDLYFAFASRALADAVNAGQFEAARPIRAGLDQACLQRFGHALSALGEDPARLAGMKLHDLVAIIPLCLPGLLHADAMLRLADGEKRADLTALFDRTAQLAGLLRDSMAWLSMDDGMAEEIGWTAMAEALLCAASAGDPSALERLAALPAAAHGGGARRDAMQARAFVEAVNGGHYALATGLAELTGLGQASWTRPEFQLALSVEHRDALFCLGVLDLQGEHADALELGLCRFQHVRQIARREEFPDLHGAATTGARLALERLGRHAEAAFL